MSLTAAPGVHSDGGLQQIGKYTIVGTLGRGSMGIVYKGQDPEIGRFVAIKTLRKIPSGESKDTSTSIERFKLEARSAGNLRHPNIITIFEVNVQGDTPYIVMDYVEGESLDQILSRQGPLEPPFAVKILREVAAALDYAHSQGVIHRDIKPANIVVDTNQRAHVLDFGIASINDSFTGDSPDKNEPIMGTPGYMSPEQILNHKLDHRSDLFSLAVVAFEILAGQRPFAGTNFNAVVGNILNGNMQPLSKAAPHLPLALEAEMEKALAQDRDERFSSAEEMIGQFQVALGLTESSGRVRQFSRGQRRKRISTWKNLGGVTSSEGIQSVNSDSTSVQDYSPVRRDSPAGLDSRGVRPAGGTGEFYAPVHEVLARSGEALSGSSVRFRRPMTVLRFMTIVLSFISVFMAGYLSWSLMRGERTELAAAGSGSGSITHASAAASNSGSDDLELPPTDPVPAGKLVEEMGDRELLGAVVSPEQGEETVLGALVEARRRNVGGLAAAAVVTLHNDSYLVRIEALKTLAELGDKRVVAAVLSSLDDYDPLVRGHAAKTLGMLGSRTALSYLIVRETKEDVPEVKAAIRNAIKRINGLD